MTQEIEHDGYYLNQISSSYHYFIRDSKGNVLEQGHTEHELSKEEAIEMINSCIKKKKRLKKLFL